jgi:hypothetical protein
MSYFSAPGFDLPVYGLPPARPYEQLQSFTLAQPVFTTGQLVDGEIGQTEYGPVSIDSGGGFTGFVDGGGDSGGE